MRLPNSQQSANASQRSIPRKISILPWRGIFQRFWFSPKKTESEAISEIVLFTLIIALLACFIGYQVGTKAEIPKGWEVLISLILAVCGYDMIKEFVASTVGAFSDRRFEDGKKAIEKEYKQREEQYGAESIEAQRHRYYLSRLVKESNGSKAFKWEDIKLEKISKLIYEEIKNSTPTDYKEELQKTFENIKANRAIRHDIQELSDEEFLQPIALLASMYALGKKKKENMRNEPAYFLFRDIYAYLKAWLICSIDNDSDVLMPIDPIGLSYPNKSNPDKEAYKAALKHINNDLLEQEKSKQYLQELAKEKVKEYLEKLIILIEEY